MEARFGEMEKAEMVGAGVEPVMVAVGEAAVAAEVKAEVKAVKAVKAPETEGGWAVAVALAGAVVGGTVVTGGAMAGTASQHRMPDQTRLASPQPT